MSSVGMLYNAQLMKVAGENGVAAYGVILYVNFIFIAIYLGYAYGSAPIVAFNYGAGKKAELQNVLKKSLKLLFRLGWRLVRHYGGGACLYPDYHRCFLRPAKEISVSVKWRIIPQFLQFS